MPATLSQFKFVLPLYITIAAAGMFDDAGINSVRELEPLIDKLEKLVQRIAYLLLASQFLFFVFVVLVRHSSVGGSVLHVLGGGTVFFMFGLWCVS